MNYFGTQRLGQRDESSSIPSQLGCYLLQKQWKKAVGLFLEPNAVFTVRLTLSFHAQDDNSIESLRLFHEGDIKGAIKHCSISSYVLLAILRVAPIYSQLNLPDYSSFRLWQLQAAIGRPIIFPAIRAFPFHSACHSLRAAHLLRQSLPIAALQQGSAVASPALPRSNSPRRCISPRRLARFGRLLAWGCVASLRIRCKASLERSGRILWSALKRDGGVGNGGLSEGFIAGRALNRIQCSLCYLDRIAASLHSPSNYVEA